MGEDQIKEVVEAVESGSSLFDMALNNGYQWDKDFALRVIAELDDAIYNVVGEGNTYSRIMSKLASNLKDYYEIEG